MKLLGHFLLVLNMDNCRIFLINLPFCIENVQQLREPFTFKLCVIVWTCGQAMQCSSDFRNMEL